MKIECPNCQGTGHVPLQFSLMVDGVCEVCKGTGEIESNCSEEENE